MKNFNLKDFFKKKNRTGDNGTVNISKINPVRDWKIISMFFVGGMVIISAFAWQVYLSDKIGGGYVISTLEPVDISVKTIDKKRLQADILILETRQADFLKLKENYPKVVDPAL